MQTVFDFASGKFPLTAKRLGDIVILFRYELLCEKRRYVRGKS